MISLHASNVTASWLLNNAMKGQTFRTDVADRHAPTLRLVNTVVMDGLPAQSVSGVREKIKAVGARLLGHLVQSPDSNFVELDFAELKAHLRSAAARTIPDLGNVMEHSLTAFAPTECRAYLPVSVCDTT